MFSCKVPSLFHDMAINLIAFVYLRVSMHVMEMNWESSSTTHSSSHIASSLRKEEGAFSPLVNNQTMLNWKGRGNMTRELELLILTLSLINLVNMSFEIRIYVVYICSRRAKYFVYILNVKAIKKKTCWRKVVVSFWLTEIKGLIDSTAESNSLSTNNEEESKLLASCIKFFFSMLQSLASPSSFCLQLFHAIFDRE